MPKVEIYTQPYCPFCDRALKLLAAKQADFEEIHAPHGSNERKLSKERSGGRTSVPQIFIGGHHVGGSDDLAALDRKGELDRMLQAG